LKSGDKKTRRKRFFFAILKNNLTNWQYIYPKNSKNPYIFLAPT
jgi:hypothetical protein